MRDVFHNNEQFLMQSSNLQTRSREAVGASDYLREKSVILRLTSELLQSRSWAIHANTLNTGALFDE